MPQMEESQDTDIQTIVRPPKSYQVVMLNDDYTTQDFVIAVLIEIFCKSHSEARALMLDIHNEGRAVIGVYSYDVAVSKVKKTTSLARKENFPLHCLIDEV